MPPAAAPPTFADLAGASRTPLLHPCIHPLTSFLCARAEAKKALSEIVDVLLPAVQDGGDLKAALDKAHAEATEDAARKQKVMAYCMPIIQKILGDVLIKYKFPAGPMGILQGFAALKKFSEESPAIATAMTTLSGAAMGGGMPTEAQVAEIKAGLA